MEGEINTLLDSAKTIVIIQADNPDGDSLASSLALEQILGDMGKNVHLYCGVDIPGYLRHMDGWDRVTPNLPGKFDLSIIVDTSALSLLEQLDKTKEINWLKTKHCIILDHHTSADTTIDFAEVTYTREAVATGELIYELTHVLGWPRNSQANNFLMMAILSDSLGLTSEGTSARSIHIVGELVEQGVSIPAIENMRRQMQRKSPELVKYKSSLLNRIQYSDDQRIAYIVIPWEEIEKYSHEYNPSMLVLDEMRMVNDVCLAIAYKTYPDGRITAKLRANYGSGVASSVASHFGGGGHPYAAGFKLTDKRNLNDVIKELISVASEQLDNLKSQDTDDKPTQYAYTVS